MRIARVPLIALSIVIATTAARADISACRVGDHGAWFDVSNVQDISLAKARDPGSMACDTVYRVDKKRYILGGCNAAYTSYAAKTAGAPLGTNHVRLELQCK